MSLFITNNYLLHLSDELYNACEIHRIHENEWRSLHPRIPRLAATFIHVAACDTLIDICTLIASTIMARGPTRPHSNVL